MTVWRPLPRSNLYAAEARTRPSPTYLEQQQSRYYQPTLSLNSDIRREAVAWLVDVASDLRVGQEALFLAVALLDRYLTATQVRHPWVTLSHMLDPQGTHNLISVRVFYGRTRAMHLFRAVCACQCRHDAGCDPPTTSPSKIGLHLTGPFIHELLQTLTSSHCTAGRSPQRHAACSHIMHGAGSQV